MWEHEQACAPAVAVQGMADVVKVSPYLVHATGNRSDEEQRVAAAAVALIYSALSQAYPLQRRLRMQHSNPRVLCDGLLSPRMRNRKMGTL